MATRTKAPAGTKAPATTKAPAGTKAPAAGKGAAQPDPVKPWGTQSPDRLGTEVVKDLRQVYYYLGKETRRQLGLLMQIPIFITDPLVAVDDPAIGVQTIDVRLETDFGDGPTSSRIAVVDFNADTQQLTQPVKWDPAVGWFSTPDGQWLPSAPPEPDTKDPKDDPAYRSAAQAFVDATVKNLHFHQVNAWTVVERVLEFYQEPQALGRPIPWGFDGNRLIVVPHAGYGENAFYDRRSKSLQFYYFGDDDHPGYTCLSHDIVSHETGHAVLDGIRPLYNQNPSVQTPAFHEFIGDLTAIMLALFNNDIRHFLAETTKGDFTAADVLANLAEQFGHEVEGRPYLRTARNPYTMESEAIKGSVSPHNVSQVLTGAMFDLLIRIGKIQSAKNAPDAADAAVQSDAMPQAGAADAGAGATPAGGAPAAGAAAPARKPPSPAQVVWRSADRFRRVALQPLDLCPPCDIQFVDYAAAVIHNDLLTNPVDRNGYRAEMLDVFHKRKICLCGFDYNKYKTDRQLPDDCKFREALSMPDLEFFFHPIDRIASSRTAAYNFLSDNRRPLRIPKQQDVVVADLYDNSKLGAAAERLPREIVLEYVWQQEIPLQNDPAANLNFGQYAGKVIPLYCGGTLVFDDRGNLLSWFRKPGTEHITAERAAKLRAKSKPTKQDQGELNDWDEGNRRIKNILEYTAGAISRGLVGQLQLGNPFMDGIKPITAVEDNGVLHLEMTPHLRKGDLDTEVDGWPVNY